MNGTEVWKRVPEHYPLPGGRGGGHYEVSNYGRVRHVYARGAVKIMKPFEKSGSYTGSNYMQIKFHQTIFKLSRVIWETFCGPVPEGTGLYHKNGNVLDNELWNLEALPRSEIAKRSGSKARRRSVVRINRDLEIIDVYSSGREAARQYGCVSNETVWQHCNMKIRRESAKFMPDGTTFAWEEDILNPQRFKKVVKYYEQSSTYRQHRE